MVTLFYILFFFVPLVLYPYSSELFEFNKMVFIYLMTTLITTAWVIRCIFSKKFIFRRTILDIPLIVFLFFQFASFLVSIDPRTSLLGFYSRFHGGFMSSLSYTLLYWAYVSNMDRTKTLRIINYCLMPSAFLVSLYGVAEHFGIDKHLWIQDVQNRVFSTLGQPNWLAAYLAALLPITWAFKNRFWTGLSALYFLTLLFTKSRSGILGFVIAFVLFWSFSAWINRKRITYFVSPFILITSSLLLITFLVGSPWTPRQLTTESQGPALEVGGTESGEIRKIVWKGAIDIWKNYPVLGTGVETFAFAYYQFRPVEHNLVSEWDFLYNKAHNEYLNYLATTGTLGFLSYLSLIIASLVLFKRIIRPAQDKLLTLALLSGYVSVLVSNFFGFSVVPVALLFFLYPAMATAIAEPSTINYQLTTEKISASQKVLLLVVVGCMLYVVFAIGKYWYSDFLYAQGKLLNNQEDFIKAREKLVKATSYSPKEALFHDELSQSSLGLALALPKEEKKAQQAFIEDAIFESNYALNLSPVNINLVRNRAGMFTRLAIVDKNYLKDAKDVLLVAVSMAPTEAKLRFSLAQTYARIGDYENAEKSYLTAIALKPNYIEARFSYAKLLINKNRLEEAKEQLRYILEKLDPKNEVVKEELEEIGR